MPIDKMMLMFNSKMSNNEEKFLCSKALGCNRISRIRLHRRLLSSCPGKAETQGWRGLSDPTAHSGLTPATRRPGPCRDNAERQLLPSKAAAATASTALLPAQPLQGFLQPAPLPEKQQPKNVQESFSKVNPHLEAQQGMSLEACWRGVKGQYSQKHTLWVKLGLPPFQQTLAPALATESPQQGWSPRL